MNKKTREEKGSMVVYVTIVLLAFMIILSTIYMSITSTRKSELSTILKIKELYDADSKDIEKIYQNQLKKLQAQE